MNDQGYNGYANRYTWMVALWIDNDEGLHEDPARIAADVLASMRDKYEDSAELSRAVRSAVTVTVTSGSSITGVARARRARGL